MGQYYIIVNLDKREYIYPPLFGDGLKLIEFGSSGMGTMLGLAALLADGNGRGGGDLPDSPLIGSWAGDRIVVAGDYADSGKWLTDSLIEEYYEAVAKQADDDDEPPEDDDPRAHVPNLHEVAKRVFKDISSNLLEALGRSDFLREHFVEHKMLTPDGLVRRCRKCHALLIPWHEGALCGSCTRPARARK